MRDARNSFKEVERILRRDSGLITGQSKADTAPPRWNDFSSLRFNLKCRFVFLFNIVMFQIICSNRIKSFPYRQITFNSRLDCYRWNQYWFNRKKYRSFRARNSYEKILMKFLPLARIEFATRDTHIHIYIYNEREDFRRKKKNCPSCFRISSYVNN